MVLGNVTPGTNTFPAPHQSSGGWGYWPGNNMHYVQNSDVVNPSLAVNQGATHVVGWHGFPGGNFPPAPPHGHHDMNHFRQGGHQQASPVLVHGQPQAHPPQQGLPYQGPSGVPRDHAHAIPSFDEWMRDRRPTSTVDSYLKDANLTEALVMIKSTLGTDKFNQFICQGSSLLEADAYYDLFHKLPRELRQASLRPPPGIVVDVKGTLEHADQGAMFAKLCQLRRERCGPLAAPAQAPHWIDESWDTVPMAKHCKNHFWDLFNTIPISTTDPIRWKNIMNFMKDCPEKSEPKQDTNRFVEWGTSVNAHRGRSKSRHPESSPRRRSRSARRSRSRRRSGGNSQNDDDLRSLQAWGQNSPQRDVNSRTAFIKKKVEEDTDTLSLDELGLGSKRKFPSKMSPAECLKSLPELRYKPEVFQAVYKVYLRKFQRLLDPLPPQSSNVGKIFSKLLEGLNVKIVRGGAGNPGIKNVPGLIATLKTLDICEKPQ